MIKPSHLLFDFYSIDMEDGRCGVKFSTKLFKKQKEENMKFKVESKMHVVDLEVGYLLFR